MAGTDTDSRRPSYAPALTTQVLAPASRVPETNQPLPLLPLPSSTLMPIFPATHLRRRQAPPPPPPPLSSPPEIETRSPIVLVATARAHPASAWSVTCE
ncbi:unnamed protein product [Schistocephalus solidus]|uniref:Uncharacterized protein n=1 Tax=Schistocephalus solidus TaxID=70667 RepID=A0A183T508_SCHSO|nr:unnamed protein product [Schistocephalus solidus]